MFRRASQSSSSFLFCAAATGAAAPKTDTRKLIQTLRARTDAPILDCKKALTECGADDIEKCVEWLKKKGLASADKKMNRETSFGLVSVAVGRKEGSGEPLGAVAFQLCTETDFSARNEKFLQLAAEMGAASEGLMRDGQWEPLRNESNFGDHFLPRIKAAMAQISENISVKRAIPLELSGPSYKGAVGQVGCYAHGISSPIAPHAGSMVAVSFVSNGSEELATDVSQSCVANLFADVPVLDFSMIGQDKSVKEFAAEHKAELRRVFMMSTSGEEPRDLFF